MARRSELRPIGTEFEDPFQGDPRFQHDTRKHVVRYRVVAHHEMFSAPGGASLGWGEEWSAVSEKVFDCLKSDIFFSGKSVYYFSDGTSITRTPETELWGAASA